MIVAVVQVVLLLIIGRVRLRGPPPSSIAAFVVVLLVGVASFAAMGVAMSTVIPNQEAAGPVTSIVFFVLLFLSGLWFPLKAHSGLAKFSNYFPGAPLHPGRFRAIRVPARRLTVGLARLADRGHLGSGGNRGRSPTFRWSPRRS